MTHHASWPDRLKWAEEQGLKNLQEKFTTADNINKEAQTTLTYVLAGMGGTFAYVLPALDKKLDVLVFGAAFLCVYFFCLGTYLVRKTFFLGEFPSPYQEPEKLLIKPEASLDDVRHGEITNITKRIVASRTWILNKASAINRVRALLVASPIAFMVGCGLFKALN